MNPVAILKIAVLILGMLVSSSALGQNLTPTDSADFAAWMSAELKYKVNKQWMLSAEEQLRLKSDVSEVDKHFSEFGLRYNAPRGFSLDGGFRWIRRNDTQGKIQGYESQRRYHFSVNSKYKLGRFSLGYRMRYQSKEDVESVDAEEPDQHLRFRAQIRYNVPNWRLDPTLSAELYRSIGAAVDAEFDKVRYTLGTDWKAWDNGKMGTFYRLEKELGVESPETTHIIGLKISHTLGKN